MKFINGIFNPKIYRACVKRLTLIILTIMFVVLPATAKKFARTKLTGQYVLSAPGIFDGTAVLAKDYYASKLNSATNDHAILGKWKFKQGKQNLTIEWWSEAHFDGVIIETDEKEPQVITGTYTQVKSPFQSGPATFTRIPITNEVVHHIIIGRAKNRKVKGADFFNYGVNKVNGKLRKDYKIVVYSRTNNASARIEYKKDHKSSLSKYGIFKRKLHKYETVEVYVVSKDFVPDEISLSNPALTIDGINVFAYDWCEKGFKWRKKEQ